MSAIPTLREDSPSLTVPVPVSRLGAIALFTSTALLYVGVFSAFGPFALIGAAVGPLLWRPKQLTTRQVALLFTTLMISALSHGNAIDEWLTRFQSVAMPVVMSPGFTLRSTIVPLCVLCGLGSRQRLPALWANLTFVIAGIAGIQLLSSWRADLQTVGFAWLGIGVALECVNAWHFWHEPDRLAPAWIVNSSVILAAIVIALWSLPRSSHAKDVTFWWPSDPLPEFATADNGFGWANIGQIGELPRLLERAGYRVKRQPDLEDIRTPLVVLPVPFRRLRTSEVEQIREHVASGGRLLVIGEHTNLEAVRDIANPILEGTGLALNFDTTNALFGDGTLALSGPHVRENSYITHNRGASLALQGFRATALLKGSWWHSDAGDVLAPERAFLSDYRLSPGDRIGNLVLAARAPLGRGEVVVWGDGSPFLNQNLAYNSRYILDIFADLGGTVRFWWAGPLTGIALFCAWALMRGPALNATIILLALITPFLGAREASLPQLLAVISDHENNGFDRDPFSPQSITGLGVGLTRNGYVPWLGDWTSLPAPPSLVFILNPNRVVTDRFVSGITSLAQAGTTVVIAGSGGSRSFVDLAAKFGVEIIGPPLGRIQAENLTTYSAWQIKGTLGTPLMAGDTAVGLALMLGRGRIIVMADSGFFLSANLETETDYHDNNAKLLKSLVTAP